MPGEHDTFIDNGKAYLDRFGKGTTGNGWRSFDYQGVHVVGLVNVWNLKAGGFGVLGDDQLAWLKKDLDGLSASTPIVVYAHVPLWAVYPTWGWGTTDAEQALTLMRRFGWPVLVGLCLLLLLPTSITAAPPQARALSPGPRSEAPTFCCPRICRTVFVGGV